MKKIVFDGSKCAACSICAIACMDEKDYSAACGHEPFRRAGEREENGAFRFYSTACIHCGACIPVCPAGRLYRDEETGFVLCSAAECVGCRKCLEACPVAAPKFGQDGKMEKCDGCIARVRAGLPPACVRACPTGALKMV